MAAFTHAVALAALASTTASASQDSHVGAGSNGELHCEHGGTATVEGADNEILVTGECATLNIEGAGNRVRVSMAKGGTIRITGASNEVHWSTPDGSRPRFAIQGAGNRTFAANR